MATVKVATEIICPDCGKKMAKKNWKDHARHKHTMTEETIRLKYEQLQASSLPFSNGKPTPVVMRDFFAKKFAATETLPISQENGSDENNSNEETFTIDDPTDIPTNSTNDCTPQGNVQWFF